MDKGDEHEVDRVDPDASGEPATQVPAEPSETAGAGEDPDTGDVTDNSGPPETAETADTAETAGDPEWPERAEDAEPELPLLTHGRRRPRPTPYRRSPDSGPVPARLEPLPQPSRPAPAPVARGRRPVRTTGKVVLALLSVVALGATGYAYATIDKVQQNVPTTDVLQHQDEPAHPAPPADDGAEDILLVGSDSRTDNQGNPLPLDMLRALRTEEKEGINTDTMIVLRIPKNGGKPAAVSIPRDSWVEVPSGGKAKINSAFGTAKRNEADRLRADGERDQTTVERDSDQAGRKALVRAVQDLTQVRIDHYAEINLLGFYLLTEALGGVKVCLNNATVDKDSGADFRAGPQTVSGGEALSFVRQRKNLPHGDLDRIVRQQAFLSSALHQVLSAGTLTSKSTLDQLTETVRRSLVLDPDLDLLDFAGQARGIASGDVKFTTIPVLTANGRSPDGLQSIVEVDPQAVREFVATLVGRSKPAPPAPPTPGGGGSGTAGAAGAPAVRPVSAAVTADGVSCVN